MQVPGSANALMLGGKKDYTISRSLRFRSSASAYLSRTFGTPTNQKIWTYSFWIKRGSLGSDQLFFGQNVGTNQWYFRLDGGGVGTKDSIIIGDYYNTVLTTASVLRDPSAWYHITLAFDTTQATATNRVKLYVNGVQQSYTQGASFPAQNANPPVNQSGLANNISGSLGYIDGYMTDVHFIDGQALTPSSFGEFDLTTGVWKPKRYAGTYGTNGFKLDFSDNSAATAAAIGKDSSGNGNNWTPNNISVTSGVTYDSMTDVPTLTSATAANYCVMNPLASSNALSWANLRQGTSSPINFASFGQSSGKWYWEVTLTTQSGAAQKVGIANANATGELGDTSTGWAYIIQSNVSNGQAVHSGSVTSTFSTFAAGDVLSVAVDIDGGKIWWAKNGTWVNSGAPASGTGAVYTDVNGTIFPAASNIDKGAGAGVLDWNFGQRPFAYTPPTGFVALNTFNLPDSTIKKGSDYMAAVTYAAANASQSITTGFDLSNNGGLVWTKSRSNAYEGNIYDTVRGTAKFLVPSTTNAENTSSPNSLTAFTSTGFTLSNQDNSNVLTGNSVAWSWRAGAGAAVSNTAGSITAQVSANAAAGFSVVTYTGTGANATVGHGLGVAPKMVIVKKRNTTGNWIVYHTSRGASYYNALNLTGNYGPNSTLFNDTNPTSSVFSIGSDSDINASSATYVAYCFSEVFGYSKFGGYVGNGSADGAFVHCGFRPKFVMVKCTSQAGDWYLLDTTRDIDNGADAYLLADTSGAEATGTVVLDFLSNGFKLRNAGVAVNGSGSTYIFAAFAENPSKYALAR